jgi:hypothetical protein
VTDVDPRKANQYTGFILKGWSGEPAYKTTGDPSWNAPTYGDCEYGSWNFGDWSFGGDYKFDGDHTFEDVVGAEWGEGDALAGDNPYYCLRSENADKITQIDNAITEVDTAEGEARLPRATSPRARPSPAR